MDGKQKKLPRESTKEWRNFFSEEQLKAAERYIAEGQTSDFIYGDTAARAVIGKGRSRSVATIRYAPMRYEENWEAKCFTLPGWAGGFCRKTSFWII